LFVRNVVFWHMDCCLVSEGGLVQWTNLEMNGSHVLGTRFVGRTIRRYDHASKRLDE
jgi:hypothetical protein